MVPRLHNLRDRVHGPELEEVEEAQASPEAVE